MGHVPGLIVPFEHIEQRPHKCSPPDVPVQTFAKRKGHTYVWQCVSTRSSRYAECGQGSNDPLVLLWSILHTISKPQLSFLRLRTLWKLQDNESPHEISCVSPGGSTIRLSSRQRPGNLPDVNPPTHMEARTVDSLALRKMSLHVPASCFQFLQISTSRIRYSVRCRCAPLLHCYLSLVRGICEARCIRKVLKQNLLQFLKISSMSTGLPFSLFQWMFSKVYKIH